MIFAVDFSDPLTVIDAVFGGHFLTIFYCTNCQTVIKFVYY